jgi:hypothetical protein
MGRTAAAALLALTVAACSTAPEQSASATGHIRSWADWSAVTPTVQSAQTASLPATQVRSWADWTPVAGGN